MVGSINPVEILSDVSELRIQESIRRDLTKTLFTTPLQYDIIYPVRGCSSAGRARQSHCRGQGFEPPHLHL